jgi:hypothetical protein
MYCPKCDKPNVLAGTCVRESIGIPWIGFALGLLFLLIAVLAAGSIRTYHDKAPGDKSNPYHAARR